MAADMAGAPASLAADPALYPTVDGARAPAAVSPRTFWQSPVRLDPDEPRGAAAVPALTIKREGDFPPFWPREGSFLKAMEDLYARVRRELERPN